MITDGLMSSNTDLWETPQDFFDRLNAEFHFDLDVCALPENAKCKRYFTPTQDGLLQDWRGVCWMNPPYGRKIGLWVRKAYETAVSGGGYSCMLASCKDRYGMVARLRHAGRSQIYSRAVKIWRIQKFCSVPVCGCGI